ncbi:hypothetical protein SPRG_13379 [Saprolegnia parasitica CBS 223.65]|uniref:BED-type domain-containing protein n=1 Tax=Saprolegnia parasitica (strain CBS 223.65) TaxID=695850 RepID=A0A067BTI2_SAPPC|nr:hypothetical protein SPRG_13379 [Saprolegnia parasitica CBS 223.65]KDO21568.1 hypothetical protein SPRG_13379 [Saprolegnia parasitica CBS 223.65]|eukprot:XP_012207745.1 hypothetical protein SPRG_13379 [Saprolegnia parasitica CBS 223.65]
MSLTLATRPSSPPPARHGNHRTAHIWEHFVKRADLGKYHNNWRVECKHCQAAHEAGQSAAPDVLISTKPKMIAHLKGCSFAPRAELAYLDLLEAEPRILVRRDKPTHVTSDMHSKDASSTLDPDAHLSKKARGDKIKIARPHVKRTHTYQNPATAHVWEHFLKRHDLEKYYNNWRVECKHCRAAYDQRGDDSQVPEPKIIISAMLKMKAHLKKCPYIPPGVVLAMDLQPSPPKSTAGLAAIRALVPRRNDKCIVAVRSDVEQEPFWIACLVDEVDTAATPTDRVVNVTWLSKTSRGFYIYANDDTVPFGSILCEVSLDEIHPDEFAIPRIFLDKIRDALARNTTIPFVYKRKQRDAAATRPGHPLPSLKRQKVEPQTSFLTLPTRPVDVSNHHRRTANYHIWEHFTKRTDMDKYHSYWYVECNHCRYAYAHRGATGYPATTPEPTPFRSTVAYMQTHLDKCVFARAAMAAAWPSNTLNPNNSNNNNISNNNSNSNVPWQGAPMPASMHPPSSSMRSVAPPGGHYPLYHPGPPSMAFAAPHGPPASFPNGLRLVDEDAQSVTSSAAFEAELTSREDALESPEFASPMWRHFVKRSDVPKSYYFWKVECKHCRYAYDVQRATRDEPVLLNSDPVLMRHHIEHCRWITAPGEIIDRVLAASTEVPTTTTTTTEYDDDARVVFPAMTVVAVRSDQSPREFWLAQLGFDVTAAMLRSLDPATVDVTWLDKSHSSGMYSFGADEPIPVTSILCDLELEEVAPGAFLVPPLHVDRIQHYLLV